MGGMRGTDMALDVFEVKNVKLLKLWDGNMCGIPLASPSHS